jgi:hypothetical protein
MTIGNHQADSAMVAICDNNIDNELDEDRTDSAIKAIGMKNETKKSRQSQSDHRQQPNEQHMDSAIVAIQHEQQKEPTVLT